MAMKKMLRLLNFLLLSVLARSNATNQVASVKVEDTVFYKENIIRELLKLNDYYNSPACQYVGAVVPDPYFCDVFYQCTNGGSKRQTCPPSLVFDSEKFACRYPSSGAEAGCPKSEKSRYPLYTSLKAERAQILSVPLPKHKVVCPSYNESSNRTTISHPYYCDKFFVCEPNGIVKEFQCDVPLIWDNNVDACRFANTPDEKACQRSTYHVAPTNSSASIYSAFTTPFVSVSPSSLSHASTSEAIMQGTSTATVSTPPSMSSTDSSALSNFHPLCPPDMEAIPDPVYCDKYYSCSSGLPVEVNCPVGTFFNMEKGKCDAVYNLDNDCQMSRSHISGYTPVCPEGSGILIPDPYFCDAFFQCSPSGPQRKHCPSVSQIFNATTQECQFRRPGNNCTASRRPLLDVTHPPSTAVTSGTTTGSGSSLAQASTATRPAGESSTTSTRIGPPTTTTALACPPGVDAIPDPTYCDKFYNCSSGLPVEGHCPNGTLFNVEESKCDSSQDDENCTLSWITIPEYSVVCPPYNESSNSTYVPHPYYCDKFFECEPDGSAMEFQCDEPLIWDSETDECRFAITPEEMTCHHSAYTLAPYSTTTSSPTSATSTVSTTTATASSTSYTDTTTTNNVASSTSTSASTERTSSTSNASTTTTQTTSSSTSATSKPLLPPKLYITVFRTVICVFGMVGNMFTICTIFYYIATSDIGKWIEALGRRNAS